jgi:hypothetical protein
VYVLCYCCVLAHLCPFSAPLLCDRIQYDWPVTRLNTLGEEREREIHSDVSSVYGHDSLSRGDGHRVSTSVFARFAPNVHTYPASILYVALNVCVTPATALVVDSAICLRTSSLTMMTSRHVHTHTKKPVLRLRGSCG